jgi:hypothetical protein
MNFILILYQRDKSKLSNFFNDLYIMQSNKMILGDKNELILFLNADQKIIIDLIKELNLGIYIIVPFEEIITNNKFFEIQQLDNYKDNKFLSYLIELKDKNEVNEFDKLFIEKFGDLFNYKIDQVLDKINSIGKENLNFCEKWFLKNYKE